jgi:hypothetical protein
MGHVNDVLATAATHLTAAAKTKRRVLSEEEKQVLRDRLAAARAKKTELARAGKLQVRRRPRTPQHHPTIAPVRERPASFAKWTEEEWAAAPYVEALARLQDLHYDHELGARILETRPSQAPATYKCLVCHKPVLDGRWIWKNDRRDPITGLFTSDVLCSQACHERFSNNPRFYMDRARGV